MNFLVGFSFMNFKVVWRQNIEFIIQNMIFLSKYQIEEQLSLARFSIPIILIKVDFVTTYQIFDDFTLSYTKYQKTFE